MARPKKYCTEEERKLARREAARQKRAERRKNPVQNQIDKEKEKERYKKRVKDGKIKLVSSLSNREKRLKRKQWRVHTRNSRLKKAALQNLLKHTPPNTPAAEVIPEQRSSSTRTGRRRRARKDRAKAYRDLKKQVEINKNLIAKVEKYRKRMYRLQNKKENKADTPRKTANKILKGGDKRIIKKKLIFGEVIKAQLESTFKSLKDTASKQIYSKVLSGDIIKKYRMLKEAGDFFSYKTYRINTTRRNIRLLAFERKFRKDALMARNAVVKFLKLDENSWQCPGKKDYLILNGVRKQKRILVDTLQNLHKLFLQSAPLKVNYSTFCKFRPYYIVSPSAKTRETCLCIQHENINLIIKALHNSKVIPFLNTSDMVAAVTCKEQTESCFTRSCKKCKDSSIKINQFDDQEISYFQWVRCNEKIISNRKEKIIKITAKKEEKKTLRNLYTELNENSFKKFLIHVLNIRHQQRSFRLIRNVNSSQLCLHIDFSENYLCKYAREPQSVHFGGSKKQLSLHTGVAYCGDKMQSFATVSECLRHDAKAIMAHLLPILEMLFLKFEAVTQLNFISDGPSSQYKNCTMFSIIGIVIPTIFPKIQAVTWNYSESGHGKGPADGIGGVLKRTADRIVNHGQDDIVDVQSFLNKLKKVTGVFLEHVTPDNIAKIDKKMNSTNTLCTVKGSNQAHQVTWSRKTNQLHFNRLSCIECSPGNLCTHYGFHSIQDLPPLYTQTSTQDEPANRNIDIFTPFLNEGEWIVISYEDDWSLAIVEGVNGDEIKVSYLAKSEKDNCFYWPEIAERRTVSLRNISIIYKLPSPPDPVNNNLLAVKDYKYNIQFLYESGM